MPAKKSATKAPKTGRNNGGAAARNAALKRLMEAHPESWSQFLREERTSRGLTESRGTRVDRLRDTLASQGLTDEQIAEVLTTAGFSKQQQKEATA